MGVEVFGLVYDNGLAGGDGNVTQKTDDVDSSGTNDRVTTYLDDWRERTSRREPCAQPCKGETR